MAATIVVIDNYDSFTYNLVQALETLRASCHVVLNDDGEEVVARHRPTALLLSPGPGSPGQSGLTQGALRAFAGKIPIMGVCLGHQAIGEHYGAKLRRASRLMHGKTSAIEHDGATIFRNLPSPMRAARYHSRVVAEKTVPTCLQVSARSEDGEIMGLRHRTLPIEGVQFHPESFLSEDGSQLLQNWLGTL